MPYKNRGETKMTATAVKHSMPKYVDVNNLEGLDTSELRTIAQDLGIEAFATWTQSEIIAEIRWTVENDELYPQVY